MTDSTEEDDAAVINRSRAAPEAFAAIFDRHAADVHHYLARRTGAERADDLVAETFVIAFRRRADFDTTHRSARPWLYGIATRLLSQHWRDTERRDRLHARSLPELPAESPDERAVNAAAAAYLRGPVGRALRGLCAGDLDVLLLVAWEQLTYDEVAAALDLPVGTVRSRLHRARKQVRDALAAADMEEIR
ncbi:RNA polymerase sigma factor [Labedaea rhizosphaerae]|uniref:RNA polymerase ECF family sigma subunit n=1 Tax=Labedaea rhizosphaerae TaxID=598644 RepID=A0A4R6S5W2_LABRH|nr:RNA polymerase sigma factor [Labedaea rhizosphaerae]TDP95140.1 RNA polymerase ECF family sigma subunit [Labedaea rhizosphaerae]